MSNNVSDDHLNPYAHLLAVKDFESAAKKFLLNDVFEYLRGGTQAEVTPDLLQHVGAPQINFSYFESK